MIKPNYFLLTVQTNGSGAPCMYWPPWPPSGNWFHQHGGGSALATTTEVTTLNIVRSKAFIHRCFSNQIMDDGERLLIFCLSRYLAKLSESKVSDYFFKYLVQKNGHLLLIHSVYKRLLISSLNIIICFMF